MKTTMTQAVTRTALMTAAFMSTTVLMSGAAKAQSIQAALQAQASVAAVAANAAANSSYRSSIQDYVDAEREDAIELNTRSDISTGNGGSDFGPYIRAIIVENRP